MQNKPDTTPLIWLAICATLVALGSILFQGFSFPVVNNAFHVPLVLNYAGTPEGPHDAFHQSLTRFVSGFWVAVSWIVNDRTIATVFLILQFAIRTFALFIFLLMLRAAGATRWQAAGLALLLAIAPAVLLTSPVGGNDAFSHYLTHSGAMVPLALLSWYLAWNRRWALAGVVLGIGFNVNAFLAIWNAVAVFICLCVREYPTATRMLRNAALYGGTFSICAAPNLVWILQVVREPAPTIDFREFLRAYWPMHTFVDAALFRTLPFGIFLLTGYAYLVEARKHLAPRVASGTLPTYVALCAILAGAAILPYATGSQLLLNTYPLRIDTYAILFLAVIAAVTLSARLSAGDPRSLDDLIVLLGILLGDIVVTALAFHRRQSVEATGKGSRLAALRSISGIVVLIAAAAVFAMGAPPALYEHSKINGAIFAAIAILATAWAWRRDRDYITLLMLVTTCMVANLVPISTVPPRWVFAPLALTTAITVLQLPGRRLAAVAAILAVAFWLHHHGDTMRLAGLGILCVISVTSCLCIQSMQGRLAPWIRVDRPHGVLALMACVVLAVAAWRGTLDDLTPRQIDLLRAQSWARAHTAPDTVFLVEKSINMFATLSRRSVWVDWQSGAATMWSPGFYNQWRERFGELKRCSNAACLLEIGRTHGIGWVVMPTDWIAAATLGMTTCVAYRNASYSILTTTQTGCTS